MFNLIISIIAIALVVALAGASLYYGGDAFSKGSAEAKASTFINQAQQIQAAATLYTVSEGGEPANFAALSADGEYIAGQPKLAVGSGALWDVSPSSASDVVHVTVPVADLADAGITKEICKMVNENGSGVVFCSAENTDLATTVGAPATADADIDALSAGDNVVVFMAL